MVSGIIALVIAYLLGSIPAAYIVTRLAKGKDIRKLGGGNAGARNVYRQVGWGAALGVGIFDVAKGVVAVLIASALGAPVLFVLGAGLAVVAGHIWSVYLKFTGGNGLATSLGVLAVLMTRELLVAIAITLLLLAITRNPILSVNISLLSVPVSGWFFEENWLFVFFPLLLIVVMVLHFLPTAKAALVKAGSGGNLFADLMRKRKAD